MKLLAVGGAALALLIPAAAAAPATAAKKPRSCKTVGLAPVVADISSRGPSCMDARVVIRSVEQHAAQCGPYRQETIAPFRECVVTPSLSTGLREFTCRSAWEVPGEQKRWWRTVCRSDFRDRVIYRRDGNAAF